MKVLSVMAERTYVRYLNLNYHLERVSFYNVARRKESVTRKTYMTDTHTTYVKIIGRKSSVEICVSAENKKVSEKQEIARNKTI